MSTELTDQWPQASARTNTAIIVNVRMATAAGPIDLVIALSST